MDKVTKLLNPNDKPFGKLSNNAYYPMVINDKKYPTVTNYILTNMLTTPLYRTNIQNASIKGKKKINVELVNTIDKYLVLVEQEIKHKESVGEVITGEGKTPVEWEQIFSERKKRDKLKKKYMEFISTETGKPFRTLNLLEIKQKIYEESKLYETDLYTLYYRYREKEVKDTIGDAIKIGYSTLFENPVYRQNLLETKNYPIQYASPDPFLGIGTDGNGSNLIGLHLQQLRHVFRIEKEAQLLEEKEEKEINRVYNIYLAFTGLTDYIDQGNNLNYFEDMKPNEVITKTIDLLGKDNLVQKTPSKEVIVQLYKNNQLNSVIYQELRFPGSLIPNIKASRLGILRERLLEEKNNIIFYSYMKYMVSKNFEKMIETEEKRMTITDPIEKREEILNKSITQQLESLTPEQKQELKERVISLFNMGMLSASLSDRIDNDIKKLNIPTKEDVLEAQEKAQQILTTIAETKQEVPESHIESSSSSSSSSSSDEGDILKQLLKDDDKQTKKDLINLIKKIEGKDSNIMEKIKIDESYDTNYLIKLIVELEGRKTISKLLYKYEEEKKIPIKILRDHLELLYLRRYLETISSAELLLRRKKQEEIQPHQGIERKEIVIIYPELKQNPDNIKPFTPNFKSSLNIDGFIFPTLSYYMIIKLIASSGTVGSELKKGIGMREAYKISRTEDGDFLQIDKLNELYEDIRNDTDNKLLVKHTNIGLSKKFENISLQNLLLLTRETKILWTDYHINFLGVNTKTKEGFNYVGKTLMNIRTEIKNMRTGLEEKRLRSKDIENFIRQDSFMEDWVKMRLKDMCENVDNIYKYLKKQGYDRDLDEKLVEYILDQVYQACDIVMDGSNSVVPNFFVNHVSKCSGMSLSVSPTDIHSAQYIEKKKKYDGMIEQLNIEFEEKGDKTREEKRRHTAQIKMILGQFKDELTIEKQKYELKYLSIRNISQIYWNRISVMISTLIEKLPEPTSSTIRQLLVNAEQLNYKTESCVVYVDEEYLNCIISAILNLLIKIHNIKKKYTPHYQTLNSDDVLLAVSIITKTKLDTSTKEIVKDVIIQDEPAFVDVPVEIEEEKEIPEGLEDYISRESGIEETKQIIFNFKVKTATGEKDIDTLKIRQEIMQIDGYANINQLADNIMEMSYYIKNVKMPKNIKNGRINFFATII